MKQQINQHVQTEPAAYRYSINAILKWIFAFTWELPQSLLALFLRFVLKTKRYTLTGTEKTGPVILVHFNNYLSSFSLGEFIFIMQRECHSPFFSHTLSHETGHSIQSRILGPLYLILVALPSVIWNLCSRSSGRAGRWMRRNYYNTPWESSADSLGERLTERTGSFASGNVRNFKSH